MVDRRSDLGHPSVYTHKRLENVTRMITSRKSEARGTSKLDWLDSRHTFSFADYFDPEYVGCHSVSSTRIEFNRVEGSQPTAIRTWRS
jgi:hypothetical protein